MSKATLHNWDNIENEQLNPLLSRKFVTGDTLTLADFALGAPLNYAGEARFPLEPYGEIRRWHASLMALPAWQKTIAQSALPPRAAAAA